MHTCNRVVVASVVAFLLNGCVTIVRKPEVNQVKKVAILSVYADQSVPENKGRGVVKGWDDGIRIEVAENALALAEQEVAKLGWNVVPGREVIQSPEYQQAFKIEAPAESGQVGSALASLGNVLQKARMRAFFTPPGMHPIQLQSEQGKNSSCFGNNCPEDPKVKLAAFAKQLDVDAVVVVEFDYCYAGGTWSLGGTGQAKMTAASAIRAVNKDGQMVIDMPAIPRCEGNTRAESQAWMAMNGGDLLYALSSKDNIKTMFTEATAASLDKSVTMVQTAMK
jgi:hypothetical protein